MALNMLQAGALNRGAAARGTTRAARMQAMVDSIESGRSRSIHLAKPVQLSNNQLLSLVRELDLTADQAKHFQDRAGKCSCLFMLSELVTEFRLCAHTKGTRVGKRDLKSQNALLLPALFDAKGNAQYDRSCVLMLFKISTTRYANLHKLAAYEHRVAVVRRDTVTEADEKLGRVVAPVDALVGGDGGIAWFRGLKPNDPVQLRLRKGHGLEGRRSNNAKKPSVLEDFSAFIDANSTPTARAAGSSHAQFYFASQFTSVDKSYAGTPKPGHQSLLEAFNAAQRAAGKSDGVLSATTFSTWLKTLYGSHRLCPHKSDYCDTCAMETTQLQSLNKALQRYRAAGASDPAVVATTEREIERIKGEKQAHLEDAERERSVYRVVTGAANDAWQNVDAGAGNSPTHRQLVATVALDYMMEQMLPGFHLSPQAQQLYYMQKNSVHVMGMILFHRLPGDAADAKGHSVIYVTDERQDGAKTNDHLLSYLELLLQRLPPWLRRLHIYGDNAATIKSRYVVAWAHAVVERGRLDQVEMSFMVPGHTKFAPDQKFAALSRRLQRVDLFDVSDVVEQARAISDVAEEVQHTRLFGWRAALDEKYTNFSGVRNLRHIMVERNAEDEVVVSAAASSSTGKAGLKARKILKAGKSRDHRVVPARKPLLRFEARKLADLMLAYTKFVPPERWPEWVLNKEGPRTSAEGEAAGVDIDEDD